MDFRKMDIKVGQLYSFHINPNEPIIPINRDSSKRDRITFCRIVCEVVSTDGPITIQFIKDDGLFELGINYTASRKDIINSGNYRLIWNSSMEVALSDEVKYGIDCGGCGKYFPDTERIGRFRCWACRNGF